jgi:hypothetical protein
MHRIARFLLPGTLFAGLALLAACSPAEPPPLVSIAEACTVENDGKPASVAGFFQTDFMVFCTDSCTVGFADTPDGESPLSPDIKIGTGANQMRELPDDFTAADFQVGAQDGTTLGLNDRVQISGRMSVAPNVCLMYVDQIRAAP